MEKAFWGKTEKSDFLQSNAIKGDAMKIKEIVPRLLSWEMDGGFRNPVMTWTHKHVVLVFVVCDEGTVGVGECWASGADPRALVATLESDIAPCLIGTDPLAIGKAWEGTNKLAHISARQGILRAAIAGIDIALWDIMGKSAGLPVWKLLGRIYGPGVSLCQRRPLCVGQNSGRSRSGDG